MKMIQITTEDKHYLRAVLTPSWLSGLAVILAGLIITGGAILTFSLNNSAFKQDLLGWEQSHTSTGLSVTGQSLTPVSPTLSNSWPLIIVWALVGVATYVIAASITRFIIETIQFRRQLDYVHANPRTMVENIIEHLAMRLVAVGLLAILVIVFIYRTLPYVIGAGQASAAYAWNLSGARYAATSFILTVLCTYAASILLRLSVGKTRVFQRR
jgi:hypothetical protein